MARNDQFSITLDAYHRWAVDRVVVTMQTSRSDLILWAVREWISNHPDHVTDARAKLGDFAAAPAEKGRK